MTRRACCRTLPLLLLAFALSASAVRGQSSTGTPPFGSFGGGPDVINLANLNAHWAVPVFSRPGRGVSFSYTLAYDSLVWSLGTVNGSSAWLPATNWGWAGHTQVATGYLWYTTRIIRCVVDPGPPKQYGYETVYYHWSYVDAFGTSHNSFVNSSDATCDSGAMSGGVTDGSGYTISANGTSATVTTRAGALIAPPILTTSGTASYTDRNGNQISTNGTTFTDTLGTTALTVGGSGTPASPTTYTYTAPSGGNATYTVRFTAFTVQTAFGCSNVSEYGPTSNNLVSEIDLPDGSKYSITYEGTPGVSGNVTGRLKSVTLPTGGTISYSYTGGSNGITCADGSAATLTRTTPDGTWTYAQVKGTGAASTTTITDPQGNQTVVQFQGIYETQRQVYQGNTSGTLLLTTNTCYNGATSPCNGTAITLPITQRAVITTLPNNLQSKHINSYNTYGMPTETDDYDYGSGAPGALLRKITITYASLGNITAFPQTVTTYNGGGTQIALTTFNYDETAVTTTSGTPQHVSVSGSRGNLTSINYPVSGLAAHSTYYDTGTMKTTTDVNGAVTTFNYSSSSCGNSFPTSVSEPLSLSRSMTWNCTGGVQLTSTDENNQPTTATYNDAYFWRPASVADPTGATTALGYAVFGSFSDLKFNGGASDAESATGIDGLGRPIEFAHLESLSGPPYSYDQVVQSYDSVGRLGKVYMPCVDTTSAWGPSNWTCNTPYTSYTYDALNRPLQTTDGGGGTVSYSYTGNDVFVTIGPAPSGENTKRRQLLYDALGRLTSVCEITGASGSGACGQNSPQTGYWTKYAYDALGNLTGVTQNAQPGGTAQTRSYSYDAMSRLTSETNPENGTTTYVYDTDATCTPASSGDLVRNYDANGNTTCYHYDGLHRVTSITYPSGPNISVTPMKVFYYDTSHFNTTYNTKGRLASAGTCLNPTCSGPWITAEDFSYSPRGELTDIYTATPSFSGYNHITKTYWANGLLQQLSGVPGMPTMYYGASDGSGLDGEGRITKIIAASGPNPIACSTPPCVSYNVAGQVTNLIFGSGDSDSYTYDPNTGRMTQYQFNVNGQSLVGKPGWNANGTMATLNITDPFNASDTQNCTYRYDDLVRLANVNCPVDWAQTFTYDAFGNITKSGGSNWGPGYNSSTNRYTLAGTSYDNNGNLLSDTFHTYQYDADGNIVTVDLGGSNYTDYLTYDALGNDVEYKQTYANGSPTWLAQQVYGVQGRAHVPLGRMAAGGGNSFKIPLVGGARMAGWNSGSTTVYGHADWQGSVRLNSTPSRIENSDVAFAPFGEVYNSPTTYWYEFAGLASNLTSNLWEADVRSYHAIQGRWITPDPGGLAAVDPTNPQSWNRYAYVENNPLSMVDPSGLYPICRGGVIFDAVDYFVDTGFGPEYQGTDLYFQGDPCGGGGGGGAQSLGGGGGGGGGAGGGGGSGNSSGGTSGSRIQCATQFGQNYSLAAGLGAIFGDKVGNNFVTQLFLGNTVSSLFKIGTDIFGSTTPSGSQVASMALKGVVQGIPAPGASRPITGPITPLRNAAVGPVAAAAYNSVIGAGSQTLELGITASGNVATTVAGVSAQTAATAVAVGKFVLDAATFGGGYIFACKP
jgi:RHS repeat-associated protein